MKIFALFCILSLAYCDLPVHCLKHQIVGKWRLFVSAPQRTGPGQVTCGHDVPDRADTSYMADQSKFKEDHDFDVILSDDNSVKKAGDGTQNGEWTMVYDEGFEIRVKNTKFFAFSKYEPNSGGATSYCDQTLVGWYNNLDNGERGCYKAEKTDKIEANHSLDQSVSVVQPEYMSEDSMRGLGFLQKKQKTSMHYSHHQDIVDKLNAKEGTWKAKVYDHLVGLNYIELSNKLGRRKQYKGKKSHRREQSGTILLQTNTNTNTYDLPKSFSWEEKLAPPRQQEQCGSCYAIATMEMLSARLKISGEHVDLSPQWSLNCNYYNQGCDGGYPFLVNKFAEEQLLVPESVEPYTGRDGTCEQQKADGLNKVYAARNYKYVGGSYGRQNEQTIMAEIFHNGPVTMSFEPAYDFMYYESGIYHSKAESSEFPEWEKVDHSVLCYGWGEDSNGDKFWMLQNSWGNQWGENGTFRMKRGVDESAIESMAEAAEPYVVQKSSSHSYAQQHSQEQARISEPIHYEQPKYKLDDTESLFAFQQLRQNIF